MSMVSGLKGKTYEDKLIEPGLPTLVERRHQTDMLQTFKIVRGIDRVDSSTWFQLAAQTGRATRSADDPLNLRPKTTRLEIRRNFFSSRVIESWNQVPSTMKNAKTVGGFKREYKKTQS
jgi:ribonuclease P/MRP protein subunit RPP40